MSTEKYVEDTLTMPSELPLFNYNINFKNLRLLIEEIQVRNNNNTQQITNIKEEVEKKLPSIKLQKHEQMLNNCLKFGLNTNKVVQQSETAIEKSNRHETHQMQPIDQFCWKTQRMSDVIQFLVNRTREIKEKVDEDDRKNQKGIDQAFRRIDQKVQAAIQSMNKNINLYFTETNKKLADLQTATSTQKRNSQTQFQTIKTALNDRISKNQLQDSLNGIQNQVKNSLLKQLSDDNMKRLAAINEYETKLTQHIKDTDIKLKAMKQNMKQNTQKVSKALSTQSFDVEKHKIFQKISQLKTKTDDLTRKNGDFVDFRKSTLENNERLKQAIMTVEDDIKRLRDQGSNFKKMQNIGNVLESLDPHLICQLGNQVKLHQKQIGKLQKQVVYLENELQSAKNLSRQPPQVNNGENSDKMTKMIKQYMSNLDFQGRVKRIQKQLHDLSKKSDGVNQLQKKIYMLGKQIDVGNIMKEIRKKADEDNTRRQIRIIDSKLQKLFDFYKSIRKDIDQVGKRTVRNANQNGDSVSLTTKKLFPANCLSCTPKPRSQRAYSRGGFKNDISMDESYDRLGNSMFMKNF